MPFLKENVTVIGTNYGKLFTHEKKTDMKAGTPTGFESTTIKSVVETTISGRKVYRPVRRK